MSDLANLLRDAATALRDYERDGLAANLEAAAESLGEPVAWRAVGPSYTVVVTDPERATDSRWEPLYLAPQPAVPEWRPIETAPVDGKAFLVWVPENKCVFEVISRSYKGAAQMTLFESFGLEFTHNATHWMPLPAAPGAGGGE